MAQTTILQQFVHDALNAGKDREDIKTVLIDAGWAVSEISEVLAEYSEAKFIPPVPIPRPRLTARDAFIWSLLFSALGFSAVYLIFLAHGLIDIWLFDSADNKYVAVRATSKIRWSISVIAISMPVYVWMTYYANHEGKRDVISNRSLFRKWLTYIALFVAAFTFFSVGVYTIYNFLAGELTMRFVLKAVTVAIVSGGIFTFYLRDVEEVKNGTK